LFSKFSGQFGEIKQLERPPWDSTFQFGQQCEETKVADNCDFCLHTKLQKGEEPACVQSCKYDALVFGDLNDPNSYINKLLKVKDTVRIRPELGTEPSLRYIPIVKQGV